ncbi:hypothetical protein BYT27DRAFT_7181743 [Phlegmacium glaucopus]|nr:hypothetical protein BYT27DRAFT_7181743 [Phlegmacium glaucopus]
MMPLILSGLSTNIKLKEIIYWAIVAAILGHLSYSLHERSPSTRNSLKRAVRIYQRSSRDTSVEEAVEEAFERLSTHSHLSHAFKNLFKASNVNCALLAEEAVQIALDNLISLPVSPSPPNPC